MFNDLVNKYKNILTQGAARLASSPSLNKYVSGVQERATQSLSGGKLNFANQLSQGNIKSGVKPIDYVGQRVGSYMNNMWIQPALQIPSNIKGIVKPQPTEVFGKQLTPNQTRLLNVGKLGINTLSAIPDPTEIPFAAYNYLKGISVAKQQGIKGMDITNAGIQSATFEKPVGLGESLIKQPGLAQTALDIAELPLLLMAGVAKGKFNAKRLASFEPEIDHSIKLLKEIKYLQPEMQMFALRKIEDVAGKIDKSFTTKANKELRKMQMQDPEGYERFMLDLFEHTRDVIKHPDVSFGMGTRELRKPTQPKGVPTQVSKGVKIPQIKSQIQEPRGNQQLQQEVSKLNREKNVSQPIIPQGMKERGLVASVQEAPSIPKTTKTKVEGLYTPKANVKLMGEAQSLLNEGTSIKFDQVEGLDTKVAATIKEAVNLDKSGNHQAAANLYNNLSEHGTELGRGVQAFSLLDKMSPEAISLSAAGKIKIYNRTATRKIPELTGEQQKLISDQVARIDKLTGREKNIAINDLQTVINEFIPSTIVDKAVTVWKAGLLTSLRTHGRNIIGNTMMGGFENLKDIPASLADILMSAKTGKRSMTYTNKGVGQGTIKGIKAAKDIITTGFDPEASISKFDVHRVTWGKNPIEQTLKKYTDFVFRTLGGADKPFWNASFARSLYDQVGAEAINVGKQGNKVFIENLVKNPNENMLKTAIIDANYATFKDTNQLSAIANAFKRTMSKNEITKGVSEVLAPFTGVPSSIVGKTIAYSPVGLVKGAWDVGKVFLGKVPISELQRQAAQEVGRGVMGTGLFALGAYLMNKGLMTGQPKDTAEANQWALENKPYNSVMINGKWRSINSIGPQNLIILAGAKYAEETGPGGGGLGAFGGQLAKDQLSQTFLAGVQGPLNVITDPARYGKSYVGNQASSIIPNIVKDTSKAFDPYARETNSVTDYMKLGIPGARNTLIPKRDVLGNIIPQQPTGARAYIDLLNSKTPVSNSVVNELSRLNTVQQNATPSKLAKDQTINGVKQVLTPEQLNTLEAELGPQVTQGLDALFKSSGYQSLSDEDKANAVSSLVMQIRKKVKGTIDMSKLGNTSTTKTLTSTVLGQYILVNPDTGSVKTIDLSTPIKKPTPTGYTELDKKLTSTYNSSLTTRINDIAKLYEDGQITADVAEKKIKELTEMKITAAKKPKKFTVKAGKFPKIKLTKVKKIKVKKAKRYLKKYKIKKPKLSKSKIKVSAKLT